MKERFHRFHRALRDWLTQVLFKRYLTPFSLVLVYVLVLGPTSLIAKIFFRHALRKGPRRNDTNWVDLKDYEGSASDGLKQS